MGLFSSIFSSHKEIAQTIFDRFTVEADGVFQLSRKYNMDIYPADYTELIKYQEKNLKMFYNETLFIREPVTFTAFGKNFTSVSALNFMEDFIMQLKKNNMKIKH